ncbi:MAG: hypothetical protein Q7J05_04380, partial [Paludibacter sp.]|nr:hypothetical protein [Paludibacter sp.]
VEIASRLRPLGAFTKTQKGRTVICRHFLPLCQETSDLNREAISTRVPDKGEKHRGFNQKALSTRIPDKGEKHRGFNCEAI